MEKTEDIKQTSHAGTIDQSPDIVNQKPTYRPDELLTDAETTAYLKLSPGTLAIWRHNGKGPAYIKIGRSVRYKYLDLLQYLENQRINP